MSRIEKYNLPLGLMVCTFVVFSILPVRIAEGQNHDPVNLAGSQAVIWLMLLTSWIGISYVFNSGIRYNYQKIVLSTAVCIVISILSYAISNRFFEDFPNAPMWKNGILHGVFRLSLRGSLISLILVPIFYIFVIRKNIEKERKKERIENELKHLRFIEEHNSLLEETVRQRTAELQDTLKALEASRDELSHQLYVQSRMIASISHDLVSPLKFKLLVIRNVNRLIADRAYEQLPEPAGVLENGLENTYKLVTNLLDVAKIQLKVGPVYLQTIRLADLINEKIQTFKDIAAAKCITIQSDLHPSVSVNTNGSLMGIVVQNLVDNAVKYSVTGKTVTIRTEITHEGLHLIIRNYSIDSGPRSSLPDSEGIGLLLVNEISNLLDIEVRSETDGPWMLFSVCFKEFTTG